MVTVLLFTVGPQDFSSTLFALLTSAVPYILEIWSLSSLKPCVIWLISCHSGTLHKILIPGKQVDVVEQVRHHLLFHRLDFT